MSEEKSIEIEVSVRAVTAKALLVFDGKAEVWVPKSMISDYGGSNDLDAKVTSVFLTESFATSKGLT